MLRKHNFHRISPQQVTLWAEGCVLQVMGPMGHGSQLGSDLRRALQPIVSLQWQPGPMTHNLFAFQDIPGPVQTSGDVLWHCPGLCCV